MSDREQRWLLDVVARQKAGEAAGIYSVCSANEQVVQASMARALQDGSPLLIEATCNQVNQYGGYTGQNPAQFSHRLTELAQRLSFPRERLILGGDHLGPSPWQYEPAAVAMERARRLVHDCVLAGYQKIHLDASMRLGDDDGRPLPPAVAAARAAELAATAEAAQAERGSGAAPLYVIGTEVPIPGGSQTAEAELSVTSPVAVKETIRLSQRAFAERGLDAAWERVIAVVVQPGVEFGDRGLHLYEPEKARPLSRAIEGYERLVYEAHSTDYQTREALRALVRDHFAILKVGPALTFAFREAVFALSLMEEQLPGHRGDACSGVRQELEAAMLANPAHWSAYYQGSPEEQSFARQYSFSDRSRYYWNVPSVHAALEQLLENLSGRPLPLALLSQYLPQQYQRVRRGQLTNDPWALIQDKIRSMLADYAYACGYLDESADLGNAMSGRE